MGVLCAGTSVCHTHAMLWRPEGVTGPLELELPPCGCRELNLRLQPEQQALRTSASRPLESYFLNSKVTHNKCEYLKQKNVSSHFRMISFSLGGRAFAIVVYACHKIAGQFAKSHRTSQSRLTSDLEKLSSRSLSELSSYKSNQPWGFHYI